MWDARRVTDPAVPHQKSVALVEAAYAIGYAQGALESALSTPSSERIAFAESAVERLAQINLNDLIAQGIIPHKRAGAKPGPS